jgi:hypothetical protein
MRITDPGPEGQESWNPGGPPKLSSIMSQIKTSATVSRESSNQSSSEIVKIPGSSVDSSKLKSMLAGLKSKSD